MTHQRLALGKQGEAHAAAFLTKSGYRILCRNFKNKLGEIDIVAFDKKTVCFIEVKTRSSLAFGYPCEAVTLRKQKQLNRVALSYLKQYNLLHTPCRFDIVSIVVKKDAAPEMSIIKNAFSLTDF